MDRTKVFLSIVFIFLWFSLPLRAVLSAPSLNSAGYNKHRQNLNEAFRRAETALNSCRSKCQQDNRYCDQYICKTEKGNYDSSKRKVDEIRSSSNVVNDRENTSANAKQSWDSCIRKCQKNTLTKHRTYEYCAQQVCKNQKNTYENLRGKADDINRGISGFQAQTNKKEDQEPPEAQEAAINQVRSTRDKMNMLAYVAAGSTAFLAYKAASCASQCPTGCCPSAGIYAGMAALAGAQTASMFKQRSDLNSTCQDISVNGVCDAAVKDSGTADESIMPDPPPPGCELNPSLCDPGVYGHIYTPPGSPELQEDGEPCNPGDPGCDKGISKGAPFKGIGSIAGSDDPQEKISEILSDAYEKNKGRNSGANPFKESHQFDYNDMTPAEKKGIKNAMGKFNQKKKDYMDGLGLTSSRAGGSGFDGGGKGGALDGALDEEVDISAQFPLSRDGAVSQQQASLAGNNKKRSPAKRGISAVNKLHELFKKNMGGGGGESGSPLSKMSVSFGDDNVGVRQDNIFLMVHRMNRKLDEQDNRFLKPF